MFWLWLGGIVNKILDQASFGLWLLFSALGLGAGAWILGVSPQQAWDWFSSR